MRRDHPTCRHRLGAAGHHARHHPRRTSRTARSTQFLVGLASVGIGVGLLVRAGLGVASWDVLHVGLAERTGASVGQMAALAGLGATVLAMTLGSGPAWAVWCRWRSSARRSTRPWP